MRKFVIRYYLGNEFHAYKIEAENEAAAIQDFLNRLSDPEIMHDLHILRF